MEKESEYEKLRSRNIARNNEFLRELGIDTACKKQSPAKARRLLGPAKCTRKNKKKSTDNEKPIRFSTRRIIPRSDLLACAGEDKGELYEDREGVDEDSRHKVTAASLRKFIDTANPRHGRIISDQAIAHVVTRLRSMSLKALGSRTRAIARAAGQHSQEKLLVTMYAMKASGLVELAANCEKTLSLMDDI